MAHSIIKTAFFYVGYARCGKGTQTAAFKQKGELVFETGPELKLLAQQNPEDPRLNPIREGKLCDDGVTIWRAKTWTMTNIKQRPDHRRIHFDGIPRNPKQLAAMLEFLQERGYQTKLINFSTSPDACDARPPRKGRFEDLNPEIIANRRISYKRDTQPMLRMAAKKFGLTEASGHRIDIDNEHLSPTQTAEIIIQFAGLPFQASELFPLTPALSIATHHASRVMA